MGFHLLLVYPYIINYRWIVLGYPSDTFGLVNSKNLILLLDGACSWWHISIILTHWSCFSMIFISCAITPSCGQISYQVVLRTHTCSLSVLKLKKAKLKQRNLTHSHNENKDGESKCIMLSVTHTHICLLFASSCKLILNKRDLFWIKLFTTLDACYLMVHSICLFSFYDNMVEYPLNLF